MFIHKNQYFLLTNCLLFSNRLFMQPLVLWYGTHAFINNNILNYNKLYISSTWFALKPPTDWFDFDTMDEENSDREDLETSHSDDWRSFRAQLVSMEQHQPSQMLVEEEENQMEFDPIHHQQKRKRKSWAFESGSVLEQGTVILHRPPDPSSDFGYSLGRQYFHKAVILILEVDDEYDRSIVTKGCILNRPTNLILDDFNGTHSFQWKVFFGGDEYGLHTDQPKFYCLHSLNCYEALEVSHPVIQGIYFTSIQNAKELVYSGLATPNDFWTFSGFISWEPNELRQDVTDQVWYAVSTDSFTLQKGLRILSAGSVIDPREAGIRTWSMLMNRIGKHNDVDEECLIESTSCDFTFDDLMLREWAQENLIFEHPPGVIQDPDDDDDDSLESVESKTKKYPLVVPGTLVRASSALRSPFLLTNQEFHKSIVLIVQDDDKLTVGVILNHPTTKSISINAKSGTSIPLRFGGHVGRPSSSDDDQISSSSLVLHMNLYLQRMGIGSPIGGSGPNGVWTCTKDQALTAVASGLAEPSDFIFTDGFCIWPKAVDSMEGGIGEEIAAGRFEVVYENQETMWNILLKQKKLSEFTLEENLNLSALAWKAAGGSEPRTPSDDSVLLHKTRISVSALSHTALKTWILAFLLNDPTNRP